MDKNMIETPKLLQYNGYQYLNLINTGTYGKIYCAKNINTNSLIAIKEIDRTNPSIKQWLDNGCLDREMKIQLAINQQNLINALDVLKFRSIAFILMPLIDGDNLKQLLFKNCRPFEERLAKKWFFDMCKGVHYLHRNNIVHRDLKLDNLLINRKNNRLMICDFGLAKILCPKSTIKSAVSLNLLQQQQLNDKDSAIHSKSNISTLCYTPCGTIEYTAPEINLIRLNNLENVQSNENDGNFESYDGKAADIYSMGVCLFEMLYFRHLFIQPDDLEILEMNFVEKLKLIYQRQIQQQWYDIIDEQDSSPFKQRIKLTKNCKKFLQKLLQINPILRPTIQQIINNEKWLFKIYLLDKMKRKKLQKILISIQEYMSLNDDNLIDDDDSEDDDYDDNYSYGSNKNINDNHNTDDFILKVRKMINTEKTYDSEQNQNKMESIFKKFLQTQCLPFEFDNDKHFYWKNQSNLNGKFDKMKMKKKLFTLED